jgi:sulfoxide reductase heme-binding subunit YedZ
MGFDLADTLQDLLKRPFIWLGFSAFVILLALAATSFNRAVRWLGGRRWQMLHRGVYAVAVLAVLHFWWMRAGKQDFDEVLVYAGILAVLLGWRLLRSARRS